MMPRLMAAEDSIPRAPGNYCRRAGFCVEILGWLTLLRLDLLGLVLIKAGRGVRAGNRRWWKVSVGLWGLHLVAWAVIGTLAVSTGGTVRLFGKTWGIAIQPWMFVAFGLVGVVLAIPLFWLLAPATRRCMGVAAVEVQAADDAGEVRTANPTVISS